MKVIENGVCAAIGFKAGSIHCGIRKNQTKDDLALIVSDTICQTAAVYTKNKVKAAPILVTKKHLINGMSQAIIVNSGNANACNPKEIENAELEAQCAADYLNMDVENVLVASTGVIGQVLPIEKIQDKVSDINLSSENNSNAAKAIMTTDTKEKTVAVEFKMGSVTCHMGGICKGSGMIHPNMGTMLAFITTDCKVEQNVLQSCLLDNTNKTFNRVSVDGDTSTNDMCIVMANGMAQNEVFEKEVFDQVLHFVMEELAKKIAADGEGAGKLMTVTVNGVDALENAQTLAMSVCSSSLVKAAMFGADANWGRVICALGYSGVEFDPELVDISFKSNDEILCCESGKGLDFDEEKAKSILLQEEIEIICDMHSGNESCTCWGCDLTYDYVKINGDYRNMIDANVLVEALPYVKEYSGQIVVVKYGGNAMIDEELKAAVIKDVTLLNLLGVHVVLVHGGGPEINEMLSKTNKESKFLNGLRVTDDETMDIVQMVLCGKVNKNLVNLLDKGIGLSGVDGSLFEASCLDSKMVNVGKIEKVNPQIILDTFENGYIPVVSSVAKAIDKLGIYNINADLAASELAISLHAKKLILLTDVKGLMKDPKDESTLMERVKVSQIPLLKKEKVITGGMIPKIECCVKAVREGVESVNIQDGRVMHSLLIELLSDEGVGTLIE